MRSAVITFDVHPQSVLSDKSPALLTTFEERLSMLRKEGVDDIYVSHFADISRMTAAEFMLMMRREYGVRVLLMGYDHRFGSDRLADFEDYQSLGKEVGIEVKKMQSSLMPVSSSSIRRALLQSDILSANKMLGYAYTLKGNVVHGRGIGRSLGFPTANVQVAKEKLIPLAGVYGVKCCGKGAICNIGTNPTIGGTETSIEIHIPQFSGNLYGQEVSVSFERFIRPEQRFDNLETLQTQIKEDIRTCGFAV